MNEEFCGLANKEASNNFWGNHPLPPKRIVAPIMTTNGNFVFLGISENLSRLFRGSKKI